MHATSDERLVELVQSGDLAVFETLVRRYQGRLCRFLLRIVRSRSDAEELVQDAFVAVYAHIGDVRTDMRFSTYLHAVAKNAAYSFLRKNRHHEVGLDYAESLVVDAGPVEDFLIRETSGTVRSALSHLDKKYRIVLDLYYFGDLSYEEIARRLHMPINTVRTRIKRAKGELRKIILRYGIV